MNVAEMIETLENGEESVIEPLFASVPDIRAAIAVVIARLNTLQSQISWHSDENVADAIGYLSTLDLLCLQCRTSESLRRTVGATNYEALIDQASNSISQLKNESDIVFSRSLARAAIRQEDLE